MNIRSRLAGWVAWTRDASAAALSSAAALATAVLFSAAPFAASAEPKVGMPIPDFEFQGEGGVVHRKSDALGSRGVVIAWFPKAFTPG